jgi:hypothetical protein
MYGRRIDLFLAILFFEITRMEESLVMAQGLETPQEKPFEPTLQDPPQEAGLS